MSDEKTGPEMWVVIQFGEPLAWAPSETGAFAIARECVDQAITDHWKHKLPMQVTPEIARAFDVRVYRCDHQSSVELPFQKWVDENYRHRQEWANGEDEREYKRYLELREKYEGRFQKEAARPSLPNCS